MSGGDVKHFGIWVLVSDKPAVAVFTWMSNELATDEVDPIVKTVRPAQDVPAAVRSMVLEGVRKNFEDDGYVVPGALVVANGLVKMLPLTIRTEADLPTFAESVRTEVRTSRGDAVAVIADAEVRGDDGAAREAVGIYIETATARQSYVVPIEKRGLLRRRRELGQHYEVVPDEADLLRNFFTAG